jgi:long-chain fatty acid transport protein
MLNMSPRRSKSFKSQIAQRALCIGFTSLCISAETWAGAFYLPSGESVSGLGRGFAGQAARGWDAGAANSNPAAMTQLESNQWVGGMVGLYPDVQLHDSGSKTLVTGSAVPSGTTTGNVTNFTGLPDFAYARKIDSESNTWLGFAFSAPFGLGIKYSPQFTGRYDATESHLRVMDLAATLGTQVNSWLSLGGGIHLQRADAQLESAVVDAARDGDIKVRGSSYAFTGQISAHIKPSQDWQLGLDYKTGASHNEKGEAFVVIPTYGISGTYGSSVRVNLPDIATASASYSLNPSVKLLAEARWFTWSRFHDLSIQIPSLSALSPLVRQEQYHNSYSAALGAEYALSPAWTLRAGYMFDQTPTHPLNRSVAVPDSDRHWFGLGASWNWMPGWVVDVTYAHIQFEPVTINRNVLTSFGNLTQMTGQPTVDMVGVAVRNAF